MGVQSYVPGLELTNPKKVAIGLPNEPSAAIDGVVPAWIDALVAPGGRVTVNAMADALRGNVAPLTGETRSGCPDALPAVTANAAKNMVAPTVSRLGFIMPSMRYAARNCWCAVCRS